MSFRDKNLFSVSIRIFMKTPTTLSKFLLPLATFGSLTVAPLPALAALDMYLELDGIQGESAASKYAGAIDVLAWSNGLSNSGSTQGGAGGAGKANFQDMSITKFLDSASPYLLLYTSTGQHIDSATLTVRRSSETNPLYFKVELKNIIVTSVSSGGSGGEDRLTENITLNYAEIRWTYYPIDDRGNAATPITVGYNIAENKTL
jgi:type VI secretion system secreted protein Hcp